MRQHVFLTLTIAVLLTSVAFAAGETSSQSCDIDVATSAELELEVSQTIAGQAPADPQPALSLGGTPCGGTTCGAKEYCCNPTCNACVPFGWSCTQEVCNDSSFANEIEAVETSLDEKKAPAASDAD